MDLLGHGDKSHSKSSRRQCKIYYAIYMYAYLGDATILNHYLH